MYENRVIISRRCPHCLKALEKSGNPEYVWQCCDCDEDFYDFEAVPVQVRFSEPSAEDIAPFNAYGWNIDFSQLVKVTVTCGEKTGYVLMKLESVERLGDQFVADHAELCWSNVCEEYQVIVSQNDWYNDLSRNPEQIKSVRYFGEENGTGREIYRDADGLYYAREVYFPRENCAKWYIYGKSNSGDGYRPRSNTVFEHNGQRERVRYDDWNGVMAYSDTFNKNFRNG